MHVRIRSVTDYGRRLLDADWSIAQAPSDPGDPTEPPASLEWWSIERPSTVGQCLRRREPGGEISTRIDAVDWWYRLRFPADCDEGGDCADVLCFDGLAGLAEVWLNGHRILISDNMFIAHEVPVDRALRADNELLLRFRSLDVELGKRRPRPAWRTPMVEHQQLRWLRSTLLGRTPGWSPPVAPVGPWRPIWLERRRSVSIDEMQVSTRLQGRDGIVTARCRLGALGDFGIGRVELVVGAPDREFRSTLAQDEQTGVRHGHVVVSDASRWWPHTHGDQPLYPLRLEITSTTGRLVCVDLGQTGFRDICLDQTNGRFALKVNGVPVFCRGACWTPLDCVSFESTAEELDAAVLQVRNAGMNMLRVGGTMVYEDAAFLEACDRHGVLLWQDFMFASMDYPADDAHFESSVRTEARQQLSRLCGHPCVAVVCGNSEVEQQAAMAGGVRERWRPRLFHEVLARLADEVCGDTPYWPSSAHGGAFAHRVDAGTCSYYGVGAYLRPLTDARLSQLRFATECLAFANVPDERTLRLMPGGPRLTVHRPEWKQRVPRDRGAGWDFEDVRDHYLTQLFGIAPLELRYADHDRYLELSRLLSGEVMQAAFRQWRRHDAGCGGALIWFLRDLWPGAGWGVIGSDGVAKAALHILGRALQPVAISLYDEGCNGLDVHLWNDRPQRLCGELEIALFRHGELPVARARRPVEVAAHGTVAFAAADWFDTLLDLNYAYRFGPASHDLVVATLIDAQGRNLAEHHHLLNPARMIDPVDLGLTAQVHHHPQGDAELVIASRRFAYGVTVQADGFEPADQYFNITPGTERRLLLRRLGSMAVPKGSVRAVNSRSSVRFVGP